MKFLKSYPRLVLLIAIIAISSASLLIRTAQKSFSSLFISAGRLVIAGLFLAPWRMKYKIKQLGKMELSTWVLTILSSIFLAFHFISWIYSLEMTSVITSVVLVTTTPIWVSLLTPLLLDEKLSNKFYIGLFVAFIGILILMLSSICSLNGLHLLCSIEEQVFQKSAVLGNVLALIGAFCAAGYVICGKKVRSTISNSTYVSIVYLIAGVICLFLFIINARDLKFTGIQHSDWISLVLIALIPQLVGHSLINAALGYLPAAHVSLALLGEPVGSSVLAYVFLNEIPGKVELLGALIIMLGIYLAQKKSSNL